MKYSNFSVNDFTMDEYFQSWVFSHGDESVRNFWESWLASHPQKSAEVVEARRILETIRFSNHTLSAEELAQLWNRIHHVNVSPLADKYNSTNRNWWYKFAVVAVLAAVMTLVYLGPENKPWKEYRTGYGETRTFVLPDGSSVVLNANSTLTLFSDWNNDPSREILLDGEAFFSVIHKSNNRLFKVNTKEGVIVEVLGTTFNVYNRTNGTKVVLNSGQIRLNLPTAKSGEMIVMKPGEMIEYKEQHYKKKEVDPQLYTAWTSNKIILDHTSLAEMVNMLKDSYGLEVRVANPLLLEQTVSGSMPLGNAEILLQQMAKAFQLRINQEDDVIIME
jgi:transmembrane sensor